MKSLDQALQHNVGLGTAPLGNMFRDVPEEEARETIQNAWDQGVRYFDTAPFYGAGLAELRLGEVLSNYDRDDYLLSTKVGRYVTDETEKKDGLFEDARENKVITDYTEDATKRSIEQSLERLKTDRLDFVFVHDVSPDFHGDQWIDKFAEAKNGAFRVLTQLREEGVIRSWGLGVNTLEPIELAMDFEETQPDMCLSATQYTLLQHERALQRMMKKAEEKNIDIVVGSPYNSGVLLGGDHYNYEKAPQEIIDHVNQLKEIGEKYDVPLKAAALQFSTTHPAVRAVIPGSTRPDRIKEDIEMIQRDIPNEFWETLVDKGFISPDAPLPIK
ncbi:D-threo-aldose 1-dehydrogenase [Thalassobacillus devorans]|uniref:D-threo-aldose 1-dehydrogenase n=1 Tax=Thalassobacillus devorans TaxID=279813 RepID=A0ABQ1NFY6_9BACI|nr:aldo/keto reductase [Thalassobacillus devorans]NIK27182.1 D-threo-aldose 1-dehydrogenase [Thalassobacillus devorans]GGC75674.1 D-threo-aldose 1-dehydrogenase [Thalassobacillus devorans]